VEFIAFIAVMLSVDNSLGLKPLKNMVLVFNSLVLVLVQCL